MRAIPDLVVIGEEGKLQLALGERTIIGVPPENILPMAGMFLIFYVFSQVLHLQILTQLG